MKKCIVKFFCFSIDWFIFIVGMCGVGKFIVGCWMLDILKRLLIDFDVEFEKREKVMILEIICSE